MIVIKSGYGEGREISRSICTYLFNLICLLEMPILSLTGLAKI